MSASICTGAPTILFLPYAGGSADSLSALRRAVRSTHAFVGVHYPGRHLQDAAPGPRSVTEMADHAIALIDSAQLKDVTLFGYSLGALVAYEAALRLQALNPCPVRRVVVAACRPPHLFRGAGLSAYRNDKDFMRALARLGGLPPVLLRDDRLAAHFLPALRADFTICDTYRYRHRGQLGLPLTVLAGDRDPIAPLADLAQWRAHAAGVYRQRVLPGHHFFIHQHTDAAAAALIRDESDAMLDWRLGHEHLDHSASDSDGDAVGYRRIADRNGRGLSRDRA